MTTDTDPVYGTANDVRALFEAAGYSNLHDEEMARIAREVPLDSVRRLVTNGSRVNRTRQILAGASVPGVFLVGLNYHLVGLRGALGALLALTVLVAGLVRLGKRVP